MMIFRIQKKKLTRSESHQRQWESFSGRDLDGDKNKNKKNIEDMMMSFTSTNKCRNVIVPPRGGNNNGVLTIQYTVVVCVVV